MRKANALILTGLFLNTASRYFDFWRQILPIQASWFNAWDVYDFCTILTLILFSIACWMATRSTAGAFITIIALSLMYDKFLGRQTHIQLNDLIFYGIAAIPLFFEKRRNFLYWFMIGTGILRIVSDNIHITRTAGYGADTWFEVGNAFGFLLLAFVYARKQFPANFAVTMIAGALTLNNYIDNQWLMPYTMGREELQFVCSIIVMILAADAAARYYLRDGELSSL